MRAAAATLTALTALAVAAASASADRPTYAPGAEVRSFAAPGGQTRVHFVTTTVDAVPATDADTDGVPDFVAEVAARADQALAAFAALGFRPLRPDGVLGGDDRIDLYLRDLQQADGSFAVDDCSAAPPWHCAGHVIMENDFVGFSYPSASLGIRVLVSHELFHGVQDAYDTEEPIGWREGSAVWAEERVFPEQGDFEALVATFLAKPARPFDRDGAGFGDLYPYGTALWPYFLEHRFGVEAIAEIWAACEDSAAEDPDFLDAADVVLARRGSSLQAAWIEFTRWNAETGSHAAPGRYPDAARLAEAAREVPLVGAGPVTLSVEGMSARYLPIELTAPTRIVVVAEAAVAATLRAPGVAVTRVGDDAEALEHRFDVTAAAGPVELIVTGVRRGSLPRDVVVSLEPVPPAPPAPPDAPDDDGGCAVAAPHGSALVLLAFAGLLRRRPRRA